MPLRLSLGLALVAAACAPAPKAAQPTRPTIELTTNEGFDLGSAPYYVFTDRRKLRMVAAGLGYGAGAHAPNEIMLVEPKAGSKVAALPQQEKFYVDLLYALAESK